MTVMRSESDLTAAILTMDVVDELRHRQGQLAELARKSYGHDELKAKLAQIYLAQGIEVPDEILEAGIKAQRERRFIYTAPTGIKAKLAKAWIQRVRITQAIASAALIVCGLLAGYHFTWSAPAERRAVALVAELSSQAAMLPDQVVLASARFEAAKAGLASALESARGNAQASRLGAMADQVESASLPLIGSLADALAKAHAQEALPRLQRVDGTTQFQGAAPHWANESQPEASYKARLDEMNFELEKAQEDLVHLEQLGIQLERAIAISDALESANQAVVAMRPAGSVEIVRSRYYSAGDAAIRAVDLQQADDAAKRLGRLVADAEAVVFIAASLEDLRRVARNTGVAGGDMQELQALEERVVAANTVETVSEATQALERLQATVEVLQSSYTYRVVNRQGEMSGLWRHHESTPGARNHYLVVEALDEAGRAATLPIRNEETGQTELVSVFAVRVPEEEYNRVGQDKMDNGIIDDDIVATKKRGALTPQFEIPTAGGYITEW